MRVLIAKDLAAPAFCTFAEIAFSRVMQAARRAKLHAERASLGSAYLQDGRSSFSGLSPTAPPPLARPGRNWTSGVRRLRWL